MIDVGGKTEATLTHQLYNQSPTRTAPNRDTPRPINPNPLSRFLELLVQAGLYVLVGIEDIRSAGFFRHAVHERRNSILAKVKILNAKGDSYILGQHTVLKRDSNKSRLVDEVIDNIRGNRVSCSSGERSAMDKANNIPNGQRSRLTS